MKKMKNFAIAMMALLLGACSKESISGEGPVVTEQRTISGFSGIDLRAPAQVQFTQGVAFRVDVNAQQNIAAIVETYVSGGRLVVELRNDVRLRSHQPITIQVTAPSMNYMNVSGSGDISSGSVATTTMDMSISGSGNITLQGLQAGSLGATISGSGNMNIGAGTVNEASLRISGSGYMNFLDLVSDKVTANTSGSGTIKVNVTRSLRVSISGSGDVYYKGNPVVNSSVSGSGKVVHL